MPRGAELARHRFDFTLVEATADSVQVNFQDVSPTVLITRHAEGAVGRVRLLAVTLYNLFQNWP